MNKNLNISNNIKFESGVNFLKNKIKNDSNKEHITNFNREEYIWPLKTPKTNTDRVINGKVEQARIFNEDHYINCILSRDDPNYIHNRVNINAIKEINEAKIKIINFLNSINIIINEEKLNKTKILFFDCSTSTIHTATAIHNQIIIINSKAWESFTYNEKIELLIHEFIHRLSEVFFMYKTQYTVQENQHGYKNYNIDYSISTNGGFHKQFFNWKSYGLFFNEWITDLITYIILSKNNIKKSWKLWYPFNVNLCDSLIEYISEKKGIPYGELLKNLIKNYLIWNLHFLKEWEEILGEDTWRSIMRDQWATLSENYKHIEESKLFDIIPSLSKKSFSSISSSQWLLDFLKN